VGKNFSQGKDFELGKGAPNRCSNSGVSRPQRFGRRDIPVHEVAVNLPIPA